MYALSIWQPWAYAILHLSKDVENRTWEAPQRVMGKRVLIHAGKKSDPEDWDAVEDICGNRPPPDLPHGALVGSAVIVGNVHQSESRWFFGPVGFAMVEPELFTPIPCRGRLGFWQLERDDFPTQSALTEFRSLFLVGIDEDTDDASREEINMLEPNERVELLTELYEELDEELAKRKALNRKVKALQERIRAVATTGSDPADDGQADLFSGAESVTLTDARTGKSATCTGRQFDKAAQSIPPGPNVPKRKGK